MKFSKLDLPSNRNFGFFFSSIIFLISIFSYINNYFFLSVFSTILCLLILTTSFLNPKFLEKLNIAWMTLGYILGLIVSPIILSVIYFGLIFPIAIFFKLIRRDELSIKGEKKLSYWKKRCYKSSFDNQF